MSGLKKFAVMNTTKFLVNTYTAVTLPLYYVVQRPWVKLAKSKSYNVCSYKDELGRTIYYRKSPFEIPDHYKKVKTIPDIINTIDPNKKVLGIRDVLEEKLQLDESGKPIIIDDRELTKIKLAPDYKWLTVKQVLEQVDAIARGLAKAGIKKDDNVLIYADSCHQWFFTGLALIRLCAVTTTLFSTLNNSGVLYGLNQSEAKYVIAGEHLLKRLDKIKDDIQFVKKIIYIPENPNSFKSQDMDVGPAKERLAKKFELISLRQIEKSGHEIAPYEFPKPNQQDLAMIMYTSGTTGNPKGVMLTHDNIIESIKNMLLMDEEFNPKYLRTSVASFLPMAHLYGYLLNLVFFITGSLAFSAPQRLFTNAPSHVASQVGDISLIRPQYLSTVPLMLERLIREIYRKLNNRSPLAAEFFTYIMEYKIRWTARGFDTPIINRLVCKKINEEFGGNLISMTVGGASVHEKTHAMVKAALNLICIHNAYGSTEVTGPTHGMRQDDLSYGRVGIPLHDCLFYLDNWPEGGYTVNDHPNPRGEIVSGGKQVAMGYYKMPEETKENFYTDKNGMRWFRTGDIAELFPDGSLKIIDRKKEITKLANGEFISLGKIESGLRSSGYVENICICTDQFKNQIVALIVPNVKSLDLLASELGKSNLTFEEKCDDLQIREKVIQSLKKKCLELDFKGREIPANIRLVKEEWSQENNMLTAVLKLKRKPVYDFYQKEIKEMFNELDAK